MTEPISIYLESGTRRVFACALDWPGWCRSGKGEEAAIEARRIAWHVLDHAWEIEDRRQS